MIALLFFSNISCADLVLQRALNNLDTLISENFLTATVSIIAALFVLTRGLVYKSFVIPCFVNLAFTVTDEIFHFKNPFVNYFDSLSVNHRFFLFCCSLCVSVIFLMWFDFLIYLLFLFLLYLLYDSFLTSYNTLLVNTIFVVLAFTVHFYVKDVKDVILAFLFSIVASFMLFSSLQYFIGKPLGFLENYSNCIQGNWNSELVNSIALQLLICLLSIILQVKFKNK